MAHLSSLGKAAKGDYCASSKMKDPRFSQNLQRSLADWQCWDVASYWVAVALGVAPDPGEEWDLWGGKKWVFWSSDPLGEGTTRILEMLVEVGALEKKSPEGGRSLQMECGI